MALSGLDQHDAFILSTTTGTGKTFTSSATIKELNPRKALIIAPNQTVIDSAGNGWKDVGFNIFGLQYKDLPAGIAVPEEPGIYITTWDSAKGREGIDRGDWDLVVVDEAHKGRNWFKGTANGKMLKDIGTSPTVKKVLYVSATPFHNAAEVGLYEKAGMWRKMGFDKWADWFGVRYDNQKGEYYIPFAPRKLAKLREQMIERGVFVNQDRNMEGYHAAFGVVKMTPEQRETLRNIDRGFTLAENYFAQRRSGKLVMATRAMRVTFTKNWLERARLPEIVGVGKKLEKAGYRVIFMVENMNERTEIYDFFKRIEAQDPALYSELQQLLPPLPGVVDTLKAEFGDRIANFSGAGAAPMAELEEFNKDRKQHLFTSYAKGGTGVSFHDVSPGGTQPRAIVYLGLPWSGVMLDQAIGRPWRYGTTSDVLAVFLTSNARPEMELVASKIAPRLSSLRASVSGVNLNDPILQAFHSLDGAIDYGEFGGQHKADFGDFKSQVDTPGVTSWDQIKIPDAKEMQGKGMKYAGEGTDLDEEGNRVPGRVLYQDLPPDLPEFDDGSYNREAEQDLKDGFISPKVPGATNPEARRAVAEMREPERKAFASAVATDARLEHTDNPAADQGNRFLRDGAAQMAWRRAMDSLRQSDVGETLQAGKHGAKGIDRYFLTHGREVLRKMGPFGKQIADAMIPEYADRSNNYGGEMAIKFYNILKQHGYIKGPHDFFKKIAKETPESQKLVDILEGNAQPANAQEANFAHDLRQWFYEAQDQAVAHKVRVDFLENGRKRSVPFPNARDDNYWPRRYPKGFRQGVRWKNTVESLMEQRGWSKSQAEDFLESTYRDYPLAGHVEKARQGDFEGYRKDLGVMLQYATELGEAMARSDVFGQHREKLDGVIAHIDHAIERKNATSIMDSLLMPKIYDREARGLVKFASDVVVLTKMPFSMLPALSQTAKAGIFANNRSTVQAIFRMMNDYSGVWEAALESGSILPQAQQHLLREMGATGIAEKALSVYGFNLAHYFGRLVASESAKVFIEKYALPELRRDPARQGKKAQYMNRILKEKFGQTQESIDAAIRNGAWTENDYERASSRNTNITQFRYDQTETPPAWAINPKANPKEQMAEAFMHTMLLLQRTAFRNGVLMKEALINEAKKGNFRPWLVVAAAVTISDELLADMYDFASRPDDPRRLTSLADPNYYTPYNLGKRELENLTFHGGIGMVKMFIEPIKYGVSTFEIAAGPFFGNLLSMGDLMLKQWPQQKNWHKRWLATWRFLRRSAPILRPVERAIGVPFETQQEERHRLRLNERYDRERYGSGGRNDNQQWITPPPLGGGEGATAE